MKLDCEFCIKTRYIYYNWNIYLYSKIIKKFYHSVVKYILIINKLFLIY